MIVLNMTYSEVRLIGLDSEKSASGIGVLSGAVAGILSGKLIHDKLKPAEGAGHNSEEMLAALGSLNEIIGPEALVGKYPHTVLDRLDQAEQLYHSNRDLFIANGMGNLEGLITSPQLRADVQYYADRWPGLSETPDVNAPSNWFPLLYGGTQGTDFELGGSLFGSVRGDEFYLGEGLGDISTLITTEMTRYEGELDDIEWQQTYSTGGGLVGGVIVGILAGLMVGLVVYQKIKWKDKKEISRKSVR
jgi:hypothetical protein